MAEEPGQENKGAPSDEGEHLGHRDSLEEQRGVGAQALSHDRRPSLRGDGWPSIRVSRKTSCSERGEKVGTASALGSGTLLCLDLAQQKDEQGLREAMCKWRSVRISCHESSHAEAFGSLMRLFHTVSEGKFSDFAG